MNELNAFNQALATVALVAMTISMGVAVVDLILMAISVHKTNKQEEELIRNMRRQSEEWETKMDEDEEDQSDGETR